MTIHIRDFWEDGVLYTNINVKIIRNIFTTSFVVLGFAITLLGSHYLKKRNVRRLNRAHDAERVVPVTWMSSWLPLSSVAMYYWKTRMLPGGSYGLLMILAGMFTLAHPYFVNNLIQSIDYPFDNICSFEKGIITTLGVGGLPSSTFACANTVYNAQLSVNSNGGTQGIWKLINYTSDNFYPFERTDVLGRWSCTTQETTKLGLTQYSNVTNKSILFDTVQTFLTDQNFLYNETNVTPRVFYGGYSTGFLAWSANETNDSNNTWAVRASLTTGLTTNGTAEITNLQCELINNGNWSPPIMPSNDTLTEWVPSTFGYLMNSSPEGFYADIELKLNAMTMISGTGNDDLRSLKKLPAGQSAFYGCLLKRTSLSPAIWGVLGAVVAILLTVAIGAAVTMISHAIWKKTAQELIDNTPAGIDDWQVALLKEYIHDEDISMNQAKEYSFGWDSNKQGFVFAKNECFKNGAVESLSTELQSLKQNPAFGNSKAQSIV